MKKAWYCYINYLFSIYIFMNLIKIKRHFCFLLKNKLIFSNRFDDDNVTRTKTVTAARWRDSTSKMYASLPGTFWARLTGLPTSMSTSSTVYFTDLDMESILPNFFLHKAKIFSVFSVLSLSVCNMRQFRLSSNLLLWVQWPRSGLLNILAAIDRCSWFRGTIKL